MNIEEDVIETYKVVINGEEQYSIWPADRENAPGWKDAGREGSKKECLDFIEEHWTDMRPKSLREAMARAENDSVEDSTKAPSASVTPLVERLSNGKHPLTYGRGGEGNRERLASDIQSRYVTIRFTGTQGETELGMSLVEGTDIGAADFDAGTGSVHLEGELVLDFEEVRVSADLDLASLRGEGRVAPRR